MVYLDGSFIELNDLKSRVIRIGGELDVFIVYWGVNSVKCDAVEKQLHRQFIYLPSNRQMFRHCGMGTCVPKGISPSVPYPYYCAILTCNKSMEEMGIRRGSSDVDAPAKKVSSSSSSLANNPKVTHFFPKRF